MAGKPNPVQFIVAELKKNKNAAYADIKAKADAKRITIHPINYGRAKVVLGMVKAKPRGSGTAATSSGAKRGPGRPKGSSTGGSKSERIRQLLGTGMSGPQIAKEVGCSTNLVYTVKSNMRSRSASGPKQGPRRATAGRPPRKSSGGAGNGIDAFMDALRDLQRERDQLRRTLDKIRSALETA